MAIPFLNNLFRPRQDEPLASGARRKKLRDFYNFPWAAPSRENRWGYKPLISVVLPVYNQFEILGESVASVLTQEGYPLELIVVDDGSVGDVSAVLKPFISDPRLKVLKQEHAGLATALNYGFAQSSGLLLTWTSADNRYLPGALQALADYLIANPSVGLTYANVELIDERGNLAAESSYRALDHCPKSPSLLLLPLQGTTLSAYHDNFINACFLYRRELRDNVGQYESSLLGYEDFDYWLRATRSWRISHLDSDRPLYQYRLHQNSLTASLQAKQLETAAIARVELEPKRLFLEQPTGRLMLKGPKTLLQQVGPVIEKTLLEQQVIVEQSPGDESTLILSGSRSDGDLLVVQISFPHFSTKQSVLAEGNYNFFSQQSFQAPLLLSKLSPDRKPTNVGGVVFPALAIPPIFRRARDNDFQAVRPEPNTNIVALIIIPSLEHENKRLASSSWAAESISALIREVRTATFVLLSETEEQHRFALQINDQLGDIRNIRLVNIASEVNRKHSLLYVLSSVDLIISINDPHLSINSLLTVQIHAALAATAGINHVVLLQEKPIPSVGPISHLFGESLDEEKFISCYCLSQLLIPHSAFLYVDPKYQKSPSATGACIRELSCPETRSIPAMEQWLEERSLAGCGRQILAVLLSEFASSPK